MSICVDSFAPEKQGMAALNIMGASAAENPARRQALEELAALRKDLFQEQQASSADLPPAVIEWKSVETSMGDNGVPVAPSITLLGRSSSSLSDVDSKRAAAVAAAAVVYKEEGSVCNNSSSSSSSSRAAVRRAKTFPPPLGSLARKSYSHCPNQVPWVLLQPIRSKNRIVLQEVKIANQMSFQPIRKEGRLVLNLIRHGDENSCGRPIAKSSDVAQQEDEEVEVVGDQADKTEVEVVVAAPPQALAVVEEEEAEEEALPHHHHHHQASASDVLKNHVGSSGSSVPKLSSNKESNGLLLLKNDDEKENAAHAHAHAHAHGRRYAPRIAHNLKGMMFSNGPDYQLHHQCRCHKTMMREDDLGHRATTIWEQHHHCVTTSS